LPVGAAVETGSWVAAAVDSGNGVAVGVLVGPAVRDGVGAGVAGAGGAGVVLKFRKSFAAANTWSTPYRDSTLRPLIALIFRHRDPDRNSSLQLTP